MSKRRYVAVAGNIGAGKSSLVKWLCHTFELEPFFEPHAENPYLADFYGDMKRWAFPSQLYFLVQRFRIHRDMERATSQRRGVVQDRTIYEDAEVFAAHLHRTGLIEARDWATYHDLYTTLRRDLAPPDLMIYLRCPLRTLRKRIKLRGRGYEASIPLPYLRSLDALYEQWFESYVLSPVLVLDTSELDYVTQLFDRRALIDEIERRLA